MNNHYIPRLLQRQFSTGEKINTYSFLSESFQTKNIKKVFAESDLFDVKLEKLFAHKLEGQFGNLLNHKLLIGKNIILNREENLLLRKFILINFLRAPIVNTTWEEMLARTKLQNHPSVQAREFLIRHKPEFKEFFEEGIPSKNSYISDLKMAMKYNTLEDILNPANEQTISKSLQMATQHAMMTVIAFWDCKDTGQEFILPKLPGISQMDQAGIFHKGMIIRKKRAELEKTGFPEALKGELDRLEYGSMICSDNFTIYPLSPTRSLICFSPYFRAFFSIMDPEYKVEIFPPFLEKEQFNRHFFEPMRMELFEPCKTFFNRQYNYDVKYINEEEVMALNALLLDMETEEFAFHDYNKIRDSFWYYDKKARFAFGKKHNFSHMG